jgi:chemotaxis protein MotA
MNLSTMVGFLLSITVFGVAIVKSAKDFRIFLDEHAILIVIGGTAAASCVCFSLPKVLGLLKVFFRRILGKSKRNYPGLIQEIIALSQASRRGRPAFEAAISKVDDLFLRDAGQVLFWLDAEVSHDDLRQLLETRAETHYERYLGESEIFRVMSKFPPAFGLLGTTLGMIALLQGLGADGARNAIGPAMSIALVATLYGIVLSNFIFIPIAENLMQQSKEDLIARRMVVEGIMLIAADKPTAFVEEKVKSFLLPSERGKQSKPPRPTAAPKQAA